MFAHWKTSARTWGDAFIVQVIAVIMAAFIAWVIWERSRTIRAKEEEEAASKGRRFLFLQADGLINDVWGLIFGKLVGDYPPFGEAYDKDTMASPPTIRNRLLTYSPDEVFRRGRELERESREYYTRASDLREFAYSQAVQLRLRNFLEDWNKFMMEWDYLLKELADPRVREPREGVLRISSFAHTVFYIYRDLSPKLESRNYR